MKGNAQRGHQLAFGSFGIKALEETWITSRQIEAARIAVTRYMKRQGQVWIRIFPDKPVTSKPAEVRMGKGKEHQIIGQLLFDLEGFCLNVKVFQEDSTRSSAISSSKVTYKNKICCSKRLRSSINLRLK